jgi:energy-coupling factor transport system permease protein
MSNAHALRYLERDSVVHRADSLSKLFWVLAVALAMFQFRQPLSGALMLTSLLLLALLLARVPPGVLLRSAPLIFGVASLLGMFHLFVTPGPPVYQLGPAGISEAGLRNGAGFFFRLSVVVLASFMLIWTTDIRDLMVGLVRLGLPYRFAFAIFMALRFLPMVQQEVDAVRAAHAIRGRASRSRLRHRFRLWQRYLFTVIINGLRKAENTAIAIESRGFGAYPDRSYVKDFRWSRGGIVLLATYLVLIGGLIYWERFA